MKPAKPHCYAEISEGGDYSHSAYNKISQGENSIFSLFLIAILLEKAIILYHFDFFVLNLYSRIIYYRLSFGGFF